MKLRMTYTGMKPGAGGNTQLQNAHRDYTSHATPHIGYHPKRLRKLACTPLMYALSAFGFTSFSFPPGSCIHHLVNMSI